MFRSIIATICLAFALGGRAEEPTPTQLSFRPTPVPDRVLLSWSGDPATTAAVTWRTDASVSEAVAEIAVAGPGPDFKNEAKSVSATTQSLKSELSDARYHTATFDGLNPSTAYAYRVGDGETWSEWFQFRTASDKPAPLQFVYVGDAQNDLKSLWSRVIRQAYSDAPKSQFFVHAGDLCNRGIADDEWGEWFYSLGWTSGSIPQIPVPGNHEYPKRDDGKRTLTAHWRPQFELPKNGPMGFEETVFYVDIQGVRIIGLNSNEEPEIQAEWLDDILTKNPNRWTIVTHHHPIYSTSKDRDNEHLRRIWQPIYDKHHVDLVLQGHDHSYGRSRPIRLAGDSEQISEQNNAAPTSEPLATVQNIPSGVRGRTPGGTVYVVSVSGPKLYTLKKYPPDEDPFVRRAADTQLYQIITIEGEELRYEARTAVGDLYDAFALRKTPNAPNEYVDRTPAGVEERTGSRAQR